MESSAASSPRFLVLLIGLSGALFVLDLRLPLGIANGVLYAAVVLLSSASQHRRFPLYVAAGCTVLLVVGAILSPLLPGVPLWMAATNRLLSLVIIWMPALVLLERRRGEDALRKAYGELEVKVQERTKDLREANQALVLAVARRQRAEEDLRSLAARLITVQDEERRRISRDLHDDVNQRLAMLAIEVDGLMGSQEATTAVRARLQSLQERLAAISDDVRQLAYRQHPSILDDLGLPVALRRYVDEFTRQTGIACTLVCREVPSPMPPPVSSCLYRVAQESLGNVAKHARTDHVDVELLGRNGSVVLSVHDAGVGFDPGLVKAREAGLGFTSMSERVRLVQGEMEVESRPGEGTHVLVRIPVSQVRV
jgi:signal transduction histidine kinase